MLDDQVQRAWSEIERSYAAETGEADREAGQPLTRRSRGADGVRALAVGGACIAVMFVLVGAPATGLGIGAATAMGWLLWRYWPDVGRAGTTSCLPMAGGLADEASRLREVVVGVDGSPGARSALDWALREARLRDLPVRLVTVRPEEEPLPAHDGAIDGAERDARERMRAEAAEVAAAAGCDAVPVHAEVRYGRAARQLVDSAASDALLVVGSRGRGSVGGALLGSVSRQCARDARGPVVVVRDGDSSHGAVLWQGPASRVVVGVDGSAGSVVAMRFAAAEAHLRGGELHVVHAWIDRMSGYAGPPWARPTTTLREQADAALRASMRAAWPGGDAGIPVRAETVQGAEWDVLTEAAEAADLLVVGSRGRTGWAAPLLGSVSLRSLTHAPCPVVVVRPARLPRGRAVPTTRSAPARMGSWPDRCSRRNSTSPGGAAAWSRGRG